MQKLYSCIISIFLCFTIQAQIVNIPDNNFKQALLYANSNYVVALDINNNVITIDSNNDLEIQASEAASVYYLKTTCKGIQDLTGISAFVNLRHLDISCNNLSSNYFVGLNNLEYLDISANDFINLDLSSLMSLTDLRCSNSTSLISLHIHDMASLTQLSVSTNSQLSNLVLTNLTNLEYLSCKFNNFVNGLTLAGLPNLINIVCNNSNLPTLNLSELPALEVLDCEYNSLSTLGFTGSSNINSIICNYNQLTSLDISELASLAFLRCRNNQISQLNFHPNVNLNHLDCLNNLITSLDISNFSSLEYLNCSNNLLTTLDCSNVVCPSLNISNNLNLQTLFLKNGGTDSLIATNLPQLQYVCVDEPELNIIKSQLLTNGFTGVINSYCSFTPGGTFYTISGNAGYNLSGSNCSNPNNAIGQLTMNITNGTVSGILTPDNSGNYNISVIDGTHTITPIFENQYFSANPSSLTVGFPQSTSPVIQNFCISPNGVHPDLEVTLLPIVAARPGFDAEYKILYKNKGTTTQSPTVSLAYDDSVLDFVSSSSSPSQTTGHLNWTIATLNPLQSGEITFVMNVNSPMETPPVNGNDVLHYTASISNENDETPLDNTFTLAQTVVNSFDPNDKTCLQGATISPEMVGNYVHYLIRFENTGTFLAQNIVVTDVIDATKFDISSVIPLTGSHPFETRIKNNKIEFIFQNIMLPFDDATNDGYVAFKIKTLPTLTIGSQFQNSASIFFDYNFPIITDPAITSVQTLIRTDFDFGTYFTIYPNPSSDILNLKSNADFVVKSFEIYNTLGMLVLKIPNASTTSSIDISQLKTGTYFLKINSENGATNAKFVRN